MNAVSDYSHAMPVEIVDAIKAAKAINDSVDGQYCCDHPEQSDPDGSENQNTCAQRNLT